MELHTGCFFYNQTYNTPMQHRYNPFMQIHKGLKAMLYHTAMNIQHNDFSDELATGHVIDQVQKVLWLFEGHAHTEDSMVFPLITSQAPELVKDFEAQHVIDHQLGAEVEQSLDALLESHSAAGREAAGIALKNAFEKFLAFNLEHMIKEETQVAPAIWASYSDADLHQLTARIVQSIPPDKNELYTDWMLIGNSNREVIQWLSQVRATAPAFVYEGLYERAGQILPIGRWQVIEAALQEAELSLN